MPETPPARSPTPSKVTCSGREKGSLRLTDIGEDFCHESAPQGTFKVLQGENDTGQKVAAARRRNAPEKGQAEGGRRNFLVLDSSGAQHFAPHTHGTGVVGADSFQEWNGRQHWHEGPRGTRGPATKNARASPTGNHGYLEGALDAANAPISGAATKK